MIRESSQEAFKAHEMSGAASTKRAKIAGYLTDNGPSSRRQIATELKFDTATVSGLVTPMIVSGDLVEDGWRRECPITKRSVFFVRIPTGQKELF